MKTVCELNMCNGCMACVEKCHRNAITIKDDLKYYNALVDTKKCVDCGLCTKVCPRENDNDMSKPKWWYQGWADSEIREHASSGGAASAIIRAFIKHGGYVASCLFDSGKFVFEVTNEMAVARKFAGSKYVKSNPEKIYGKIQSLLKANQKVLFIGLPCQVAAVNQFIKDKTNLVRSMDNPVISPEKKSWDADAVYKPTVVLNKQKNKLLMWYNGRKQNCERIGLAEYRIK